MQLTVEPGPDPEEAPVQKSHLNFPVIGIGASAGGISALQRLFSAMPDTTGMAFVIVVHLSPDHESSLDTILQRTTRMPVLAVVSAVPIELDHVYVISPSMGLSMTDGHLRVKPLSRNDRRATAIDLFFRSLAQAHEERAVCIVLSGTGADGTQGMKRVKEHGGVSLVQSPEDAEYDGMPRSAIDTGLVDHVLPIGEMPAKLAELWANARRLALPSPPADLQVERVPVDAEHLAEEALLSIKALLRERTGHNFVHYKRATVLRRLERRMQVTAVPDLPSYRRFLETHPLETPALLQDMLISVTNFFRDPPAFEALERSLQASIQSRGPKQPFRAWVAGCATGEEAYSVAIVLHELLGGLEVPIQVFASDIDQRAVAIARAGSYPPSIATDVAPDRLRRFFGSSSQGFRIAKAVRESVIFSAHNVLSDPPFTRMDLICCRNLLIYLDRQAQVQLLRSFHFALNPDGLLFLGSSETSDAVDGLFIGEDKRHRLYRAAAVRTTARPLPTVPRLPQAKPRDEAPPTQLPAPPQRPPLEVLHERIQAAHAPPTVLVDADDTVLHVSDRATHLLRVSGGAPSNKLLTLVRPEIRIELRAALARAAETGRSVEAPRLRIVVNGRERHLGISVRPVADETAGGLFLVVFDETDETLAGDGGDAADDRRPMLAALENQLLEAEKQLRNSAGESAASTEELRASNEELQTINEELRSTTEELETSREELQAVNEELITVNSELQLKIEETGKVNDDLQNLIVSAEIGTVFLDRGGRVKRFTPQAATLFNLLPSDIGRPLLDLTHRLDYPELGTDIDEVFNSLRRIEREIGSKAGRWFLFKVLPYRTGEDRIDGAIVTFVDVTAHRAVQEQLRLSDQRMRLVSDSMRDYAIVTMDTEAIITSWSPGAERVFGHRADEAVGRSIEMIFTAEDIRTGAMYDEMRRAREDGRAQDDRWHRHKDGTRIFCSGIMTPLLADTSVGYAKIARDFTSAQMRDRSRDAALDEERSQRGRLEQASVLKDEFLAVMSHELKNPLSIILMNAQLLIRLPELDLSRLPRALRAATAIKGAVASQTQIIDDLLDLSRVNTRKVVLNRSRIVLDNLIQHIAETAESDMTAKGQTLHLALGAPLPVFADPVRVEQIVWNLVTNAVKFTPEGGSITLRLSVEDGMARCDVVDTGIGLEPHQLGDVFEMFHQVDTGTRRRQFGLGIGLALVKQLAELHGGRVAAASDGLGTGSSFSVWLPIDGETHDTSSFDAPRQGVAGLRLLLVDDEPQQLEAFGDVLRLEGAEVTIVDNAADALAHALGGGFDLVFSDIAMPEKDGYWLIDQLRRQPQTGSTPVIAVSGMARRADRQRALESGFDAHLGKPMELDALKAEVERLKDRIGRGARA